MSAVEVGELILGLLEVGFLSSCLRLVVVLLRNPLLGRETCPRELGYTIIIGHADLPVVLVVLSMLNQNGLSYGVPTFEGLKLVNP